MLGWVASGDFFGGSELAFLTFYLAAPPPNFPGPATGTGQYTVRTQVQPVAGCSNIFSPRLKEKIVEYQLAGTFIDGTPEYQFVLVFGGSVGSEFSSDRVGPDFLPPFAR